jgi:hypothetical protein
MQLRNAFVAGFTALTVPFLAASPAHAGPGEWDPAGSSYFSYHSSTDSFLSTVVNSGGGNFKFCISGLYDGEVKWFNLKEYDGSNADEHIAGDNFSNGQCGTYQVGNYGDGDNGTPELYVETSRTTSSTYVKFYD